MEGRRRGGTGNWMTGEGFEKGDCRVGTSGETKWREGRVWSPRTAEEVSGWRGSLESPGVRYLDCPQSFFGGQPTTKRLLTVVNTL